MDSESSIEENPQRLVRIATELEQVAAFMSRPDARVHVMERAAECLAKAVLIRAARGVPAEHV